MKYLNMPIRLLIVCGAAAMIMASQVAVAAEDVNPATGQTVYVPAYSHIYVGNREQPYLLTVTLSIRNTNSKHAITVSVVDYYETQGQRLKAYLDAPKILAPLASMRYVVPQKDKSGGSGANFIVTWSSKSPVNPPLIETVMIGTESQLGISFTSRGQVVDPGK